MNEYHNWFGVGLKGGGTLGVVGFETMEGSISNLGMPSHSHSINMSYMRVGAGLGGGAGLCMIYVYNCINPKVLDGTNDSSWSINISLGEKWSSIASYLSKSKIFDLAPKLIGGLATATKFDLDNIRNVASYLFTAYELTDMTKNKVVAIDVPLAGIGAEISAQKLYGTIFIGDLTQKKPTPEPTPSGVKRGSM